MVAPRTPKEHEPQASSRGLGFLAVQWHRCRDCYREPRNFCWEPLLPDPLPDPVMSNQGFCPTYVTIFKVLPFTAFSILGDWVSDLIILSNLLVWLVNSINIRGVVTGVMKQFHVWLLA